MNVAPIPGRPEEMGTLIMQLHTSADDAPMQMISASRLAYLLRVESAAQALIAALAVDPEEA